MSHIEKAEAPDFINARTPQQALGRSPPMRLGNPGPLGLFSFASTTLILSLYNAQVRHITTPNVVVGMACFVGGLAQFVAGMWEFATGNSFGATAFTSYGGFWMSFAIIYWPSSGVLTAYSGPAADQLASALGVYLITWCVVTFLLLIAALRRNIGLIALFFFLTLTFLLLAIAQFSGKTSVAKGGGVLGVITALIAYYVGMAELLTRDDSWIVLPLGTIAKRSD